jgi:peptidoglycan hydrolase CwlO-like protein
MICILMKKINILKTKSKKIFGSVGLIAAIFILVFAIFPRVQEARAESVQEKINALQQENSQFQNAITRLASEATSYADAINKLKAQIDTLQGQINNSTKEQERLQNEITEAEKELTKQKTLLGKNIKAMYLEGDISTIEMLASSKDLSEYVDKAQYRNSVKDKIKESVDKITKLKQELVAKKEGVEALLKEQQTQQATLDNSRSEQANLLNYNQSQQNDFNSRTKDNQSKIDSLIASQRRANFNPDGGYYFLRFPGFARGVNANDYPYRNAGFGMSPGPGCVDNDGPDRWGYCTRQCVSYAAWAVEASGRSAPMYYGNARDWVAAAYARGVTVSRTPQPGDVAISTSGYWGHAMYVESVGNGTFNTSEYNTYLTGQLSNQTRRY